MELIAGENDSGRRLDRILRKALSDLPLPLIHKLLRQKLILLDGKPGKARDRVENGVIITIPNIKIGKIKSDESHIKKQFNPKKILLPDNLILWQDDNLLAVNKPKGISVHGTDSLEIQVREYLKGKMSESLSFKSGPLHRLDKPSSGIVVFSKTLEGARLFSSLLRERKVKKTYLAVVEGIIKNEETWQDELYRDKDRKKTFVVDSKLSKKAVTKIKPVISAGGLSLISAQIITGRTHQIRSQAAFRGHPLAGDIKYGGKKITDSGKSVNTKNTADFYLHAWKLEFLEREIIAPIPEDFLIRIN
ncbi:MAG: RluA family pseudouridine synthase [Treponema sp.]|nr:RluA family pseudouridine synthase [Treponema sp.]